MTLTYDDAQAMVAAAVAEARSIGIEVAAILLNDRVEIAASGKMDRAYRSAPVLAEKKAFTALNFGVPTATMVERVQPLGYQQIVAAADSRLTFIAGGLPIVDGDGETVGAIGVSGGSGDQDVACCEAALAALAGAGS